LSDALGSTEVLTDNSGSTLAQYTFEPFGKTTISGSSASSYQFTGRENDGTGVYYYRARYYNPTLQRFVSEDPAGLAGGNNFYAYVGDGPSVFTDPTGLSPLAGRGCKFQVTRDCFDSSNGVRHIDYKLVTDSGGDPLGHIMLTEQLTNTQLAPPWGQSPGSKPNSFNDVIGNPFCAAHNCNQFDPTILSHFSGFEFA
jgi:RHS repeat-associated protein